MQRQIGILLMAFLLGVMPGVHAGDSARPVTFNIDAQPLDTALLRFSEQAGIQVLVPTVSIDGIRTAGVHGEHMAERALEALLKDSGLTYTQINARTIAIRSSDKQTSTGQPALNLAQVGASEPELSPSQAQREEAKAADPKASEGADKVQEIIVTAQKRAERLLDVPQSVSVLSSEQLANLGATQFRDFANTIPGLSFSTAGAGFTQISLRGVTVGYDISSTVGIYVDDVPYGMSSPFGQSGQGALDVALFDVDRIEVQRGPQGTLYGASTLGGLIKYVMRQPDTTGLSGNAQAGASATEDGGTNYNFAGVVNVPIAADRAALRASGFYSKDGGYIDNVALGQDDVNSSDVHGGRLDLLLTPTDAFKLRIAAFLQNIARDGEGTVDYPYSGPLIDGSLDQRRQTPEPFDQRFRLVSATALYDFERAAFTSISSYQTVRREFFWDVSPAYIPLFQAVLGRAYSAVGVPNSIATDKFVQEVRLASKGAGPLEWLVGAFYTHETSDYREEFAMRDLSGQIAPNDLFTFRNPTRFDEYAAFGNLTWRITARFDVTGGIRYARNDQEFTQFGSGLLVGSIPTVTSSEDVVNYLANARYRFTDHATGYVRYATGYRPGGPNFVVRDATTGLPIVPETFDADRLRSYEIGVKAETSDRRFGVDVAAYAIDWNNIQIAVVRGGFGAIANAPGGATVHGAELALSARPAAAFALTGAFAYQDAKMSEADADLGAANDERLPNVPRFTGALSADYEFPLSQNLRPTLGATLRYVGDRMARFDSSPSQYRLPDYTTFDVRLGFDIQSTSIQVYGHNLFDERGQLSTGLLNFGNTRVAISQPRTFGITLFTRFR